MRQQNAVIGWGVMLILSACFAGCATVPYSIDAPKQFKRFEDKKQFKYITADGVMLKAREVDNYPVAKLSFWKDATKAHLEKSGYIHHNTECFKTNDALDGCTLTFALPHGAEDWIFQETIFVVGERLVLVEATGEFTQFKEIETDLNAALKTFSPNL